MNPIDTHQIGAAEVVLPCDDLQETLDFFTNTLGFRIDRIYPADSPRVADISAYGICVRLNGNGGAAQSTLSLVYRDADAGLTAKTPLIAPNGTRIEFRSACSSLELESLEPSLIVRRLAEDAVWGTGRAGMQYRDLIPGRLGGRYIASHIRIPNGGPVPDYVHHHHILFQIIYCYRGWVRLVYEDQGPPFVMAAGDCVLQPPHIRHRVLECSDGFEVIEIGCPAEHDTLVDHDLELPTAALKPERDFGGQPFSFHQCADATWLPWHLAGFETRDTGFAAATSDLVSVDVVRPTGTPATVLTSHDGDLLFNFVLAGSMALECQHEKRCILAAGDSATIPAGMDYVLSEFSADLEFLAVRSPARST